MDSSKKIYKKFLTYEKNRFFNDSDSWLGVSKTTKKTKEKIYNNYYKVSYYRFLSNVKNLVFPLNPFDFIEKGFGDSWKFEVYVSFLKKEGLINVLNNEIIIKNKEFFNNIPKLQTEQEVKKKIEKKTGKEINENKKTLSFINQFKEFSPKEKWDQMPISQSSAIFSIKKILDYIPLNKKFLFIGDDDFLSVFLSLADENIECLVVDVDKNLIDSINFLSLKFNLKIETRLIDTRKKIKLKEEITGFWCNPPYTEKGIKTFVEYGTKQFKEEGGNVFIAVGFENIGNRILFLQSYFNKKNLALSEAIVGKIFYPYINLYKEDKQVLKKMEKYFSSKKIEKNSCLGASLLIFNYIPFKVKRVKASNSIYSYL